jgi:hypothetical protein
MKRFLFAMVCLFFAGLGTAEAATCSKTFYRDVLGRFQTLERESGACKSAMRANDGVKKMCATCRKTFSRIQSLDSVLRKNLSCFEGRQRQEIHKVLAVQQAMSAVSKRCGQ